MSRTAGVAIGAAVVALLVIGFFMVGKANEYKVSFAIPSAAQLADGSPVLIRGFQVGNVSSLSVRDGKAVVEVEISGDDVPLHDGTTTMVEWSAALGERFLTVFPGPTKNPEIPSGGLITNASRQIEVDQVLSALDTPTRARVSSLLQQLNTTFKGNDQDLKAALDSAGPTVQALGEVLSGVGKDGPAIKELAGQLHHLIKTAVDRQNRIRGTVNNVTGLTTAAAVQQEKLAEGLQELPSTLQSATTTLNKVQPATDATVPLLDDLRPGVHRLVGLSKDLSPLMHDLQPAAERLRPTVEAAHDLLDRTPGLLDSTHDTLPTITHILKDYQPAASFIRPYAPETMGWISNWAAAFGSYDSQGHYWPALLATDGADVVADQPARLPGQSLHAEMKPGEIVGQPWTDDDATGSEPR